MLPLVGGELLGEISAQLFYRVKLCGLSSEFVCEGWQFVFLNIFHQSLDADEIAIYFRVGNIQVKYLPCLATDEVLVEIFKTCRTRADFIHIVGSLKWLKCLAVVGGSQIYCDSVFFYGRSPHLLKGSKMSPESVYLFSYLIFGGGWRWNLNSQRSITSHAHLWAHLHNHVKYHCVIFDLRFDVDFRRSDGFYLMVGNSLRTVFWQGLFQSATPCVFLTKASFDDTAGSFALAEARQLQLFGKLPKHSL